MTGFVIFICCAALVLAIFINVILISLNMGIHPYDHRWVATVKPVSKEESVLHKNRVWFARGDSLYYQITVTDKKTGMYVGEEHILRPSEDKNEKRWARGIARNMYGTSVRTIIANHKERQSRATRYSKEEFTL